MIVKLLTEHHLEFLSLKEDYRGYSESTLVKMSNCWKSHAVAQLCTFMENNVRVDKLSVSTYGNPRHKNDFLKKKLYAKILASFLSYKVKIYRFHRRL